MNKLIYVLFFVSLFLACSKDPQSAQPEGSADQIGIKLSSDALNASDATSVKTLDGYLFISGVLSRLYPNLTMDTKALKLPIIYYEGIAARLYLVANTGGVTSALNDPSTLVVGVSLEDDFPLHFGGESHITPTPLPLGSKTDLSNINPALPLAIKLQHAHARLDLKIEEPNVEITGIEFKNLPQNGYLVNEQVAPSDYTEKLFDFSQEYTTPITSSQTIGYINEGRKLNIPVTIHGRLNGIQVKMSLTLPSQIKRNARYTIRITKVGVTLMAMVTIPDWADGGESDATPDVDTKVFFDPASSVLPEGVRYSATLDTLYVPSNRDNTLTFALKSDYEVSAEISGHSLGLKLTPDSGFNRYQMQVNGQQVGAPAYYSYLKIKNKFFENYYGERLVVTVAPNYTAPISDVELLATISGIQITDNLASVAAYGSSVTIPAAKLRANDRTMATIQDLQILSSPTTVYKAIKLVQDANNLRLNSVQNTTGESQTVTAIVNGTAADGGVFAVLVSFTIPAVPAQELAALNALCVQLGGNTWMQFNTRGTYASDIQNAVAISQLGDITFEKIKANFARFGLSQSTYNTANPCPAGFRTPSLEEFLNLLGVDNTAGFSALGGVSATPVTTTGGMLVTYSLFKNASDYSGEAAITIQKDGRTVYLTNGRYVATPSRTFFEFWQSGAFSTGQAGWSAYNWTKRCVQITNYNGLES